MADDPTLAMADLLATLLAGLAAPQEDAQKARWGSVSLCLQQCLDRLKIARKLRPDQHEVAIQDTLVAILSNSAKLRSKKTPQLQAWVCRVLHDKAVNAIRRDIKHRAQSLEDLTEEPLDRRVNEGKCRLQVEADCRRLVAGLKALKDEDAQKYELVCAHHLEGRRCKELATETGHSIRAIEDHLARGRRRLGYLTKRLPVDDDSSP